MSQQRPPVDLNIYFLLSNRKKSKDYDKDMWHAYYKCREYGLYPVWINKQQYNKMKLSENDVIVMEKPEEVSINKLKTTECCIIGPRYLSFCFSNEESIPDRKSPAHTTAMENLCIYTSGLSFEDKGYIQRLVECMSGNFATQLDDKVTHLVTSSVLSTEYEEAINMKIPIVTKDWVEAIWEANRTNFIMPDDKMFDKYKVRIFHNLVITVTNVRRRQKEEIKRLINDNGGVYMGPLDGSKVNLVLVPKDGPISQKLKYAREADIICLTLNWLYESINVGYALPFRKYLFQIFETRSPSKKSDVYGTPSCSTISSITCDVDKDNVIDKTTIETVCTLNSVHENVSTVSTVTTVLDRLLFNEAKSAGLFLNGCNIYLAGFTSDQRDKLNKILSVGSARQLDDISHILTHVIVGDEDRAASKLELLKSKGLCPYILTLEWLEESIKLKQPALEENFLYKQESNVVQNDTEPLSSLSEDIQLLLQEEMNPFMPFLDIDQNLAMSEGGIESFNFDQQNLQNTIVATDDKTVQEYLEPHIPVLAQKPGSHTKCSAASGTDDSDFNDRLFEGLTFVICAFNEKYNYVVENIIAMNGRIVPSTFVIIPDYAIVPKCGTNLKYTAKETVTDLFIEDCINQDRIVEIMYYHRPVSVTKRVLSDCVFTMSKYVEIEQTYLVTLATKLGAICQDIFVRETIPKKSMYKNTHLICPLPEGKKYDAAVRWKIPVVTAEWLKACMDQSTRVDETPFFVEKNLGAGRPIEIGETDVSLLETNSSQIIFSTEPIASGSSSCNIIVSQHLPILKCKNNTSGDSLFINEQFNLPMNANFEPLEIPRAQVLRPIPSSKAKRPLLQKISHSSDLKQEEPPLKRPSNRLISILKKNWQGLKENVPERYNANEIFPAAAKNDSIVSTSRKFEFTDDNDKIDK